MGTACGWSFEGIERGKWLIISWNVLLSLRHLCTSWASSGLKRNMVSMVSAICMYTSYCWVSFLLAWYGPVGGCCAFELSAGSKESKGPFFESADGPFPVLCEWSAVSGNKNYSLKLEPCSTAVWRRSWNYNAVVPLLPAKYFKFINLVESTSAGWWKWYYCIWSVSHLPIHNQWFSCFSHQCSGRKQRISSKF